MATIIEQDQELLSDVMDTITIELLQTMLTQLKTKGSAFLHITGDGVVRVVQPRDASMLTVVKYGGLPVTPEDSNGTKTIRNPNRR